MYQAEDGIRAYKVTGVQTCALPICPEVTALQRRLTELGYWVGKAPSGKFGNDTTQAIYAFQKVEGLPTSGKADPATRQQIGRASCRERRWSAVEERQRELSDEGRWL